MSIRLSSYQIHNTGLNGLLEMQKAVSKTQEQISANKRVLSPGDDPVASTRILALNQELALNSQYKNNLETLRNRLNREEVAINSINELVFKAQELVTQAGDGALNKEQRGYIAVELQSTIDAMAQMMNSRDASGEYIFAGYQGSGEPFVRGVDGRYRFTGDEGQRSIQIAPAASVASSDSGKKIFVDVRSVEPTIIAHANPGNRATPPASISGEQVLDAQAFADFYPEDVVIEFRPLEEMNPPQLSYHIRQRSDGRILVQNKPYVSGEQIEFSGVAVNIAGQPAVGDTFIVESSNRKGLLTGLEDFVAALNQYGDNITDKAKLATQTATTLSNLGNAQSALLETRSSIGARLNLVDSTLTANEDSKLTIQTALSSLQDLDYAAAISQLTQESFILEAAQASFARVSKLSIFNYI
ncbi:MAG: flagellar hook-associated protein FlgL [Pseudomonadales bacterium]|nr:flagellar hook-associated protein FlgL [Pseudomonadales bacterium]